MDDEVRLRLVGLVDMLVSLWCRKKGPGSASSCWPILVTTEYLDKSPKRGTMHG
jgi:hypothetical protein